jgi:tRNA dimethylallyltransferase
MTRHVLGEISLDEAIREMQRDTRRYAKRQVTWFRGDPEFEWVLPGDKEAIVRMVLELLGTGGSKLLSC